ncbi:agamous-like MADS-box protein AP1 [Wolffia australiana]
MGRGKVKLQRIDDRGRRLVCFSKRRNNLLKKARELAVLCDVEVAVVVFSAEGDLYSCSTQSSPKETFDRYKRFIELERNARNCDPPMPSGCLDSEKHQGWRAENRCLKQKFMDQDVSELSNLQEELARELIKIKSLKNELLKDAAPNLD